MRKEVGMERRREGEKEGIKEEEKIYMERVVNIVKDVSSVL